MYSVVRDCELTAKGAEEKVAIENEGWENLLELESERIISDRAAVHNGGQEDDNISLSEVKFTLDFFKENKRFRLFLSLYLFTLLILPRSSNQ